jgi:crotonobetainyl-CoA:carnitine CoA-transferase CaiB-like acyl-CoA transferase
VVKVEPPQGEYARIRGPRRVGPDGTELSSYNAAINRGKRSIALDLKNPQGFATALRLAESADVIVENFAPGALARLGLSFPDLRKANPRLITVSISLYGSIETAGALATRGGLAIVAEGESSVTGMTRDKEGTPLMGGVPLGDMATGMAAFAAVSTALYERERTGLGQHLDISMVRTLWALNACAVTGAQIANANRFDLRTAGYGIFPATDGFITLGINNDSLFERAMTAMGMPELAEDPRYKHYQVRDGNADEVDGLIRDWTSKRTVAEIVATVGPSGVPCGAVASPGDILADPDLRRIGFIQPVDEIPRLAAHAQELLAEIGIDEEEYLALRSAGAFGAAQQAESVGA